MHTQNLGYHKKYMHTHTHPLEILITTKVQTQNHFRISFSLKINICTFIRKLSCSTEPQIWPPSVDQAHFSVVPIHEAILLTITP